MSIVTIFFQFPDDIYLLESDKYGGLLYCRQIKTICSTRSDTEKNYCTHTC